jgi:hypothetical protein
MNTLASKPEDIKIFLERAKERHADKEIQEEILNKLPDIFLDYVSDILSNVETPIEQENIIIMAAGAWNLSFASENKIEEEIERFIKLLPIKKDPDILTAVTIVLRSLIRKKKNNYYFIERFIDDVIFTKEKDGFSLKVISDSLP